MVAFLSFMNHFIDPFMENHFHGSIKGRGSVE